MKERRRNHAASHRRLTAGVFLSGVVAFVLTGCGGDNGSNAGADGVVTEELRIAYSSQPPTLDPSASTAIGTRDIARNAFEQLLAMDSEGELHGVLAESWEEHDDGSVTFVLRDDVTFHDGSDVTAEDVAASLRRGFELQPLGQQYFADAEVTVDDEYTLTLTVPEPTAAYADEQFYTMNGSFVAEDNPWYTDAGLEGYGDPPDPAEAERLLEEAGYDGEPVRIVASQEYQHHYDAAIMVEQQPDGVFQRPGGCGCRC